MRAVSADRPGRSGKRVRPGIVKGTGDLASNKTDNRSSSPYIVSNPYQNEIDAGEHIAPRAKTASTALDRVKGTTKESADLLNAIMDAESALNGKYTGDTQVAIVKNQSLEESYLRSWQSIEKQGQAYRLDLLTKMYKKAKKKAVELQNAGGDSFLPLKIHTQQGGRVYNALATLLYASIGSTKMEELESFILKKGVTLPSSIFDLQKWNDVLDVARAVRTNPSQIGVRATGNQEFISIDKTTEADNLFNNTMDLRLGETLEDEGDTEYAPDFAPESQEKMLGGTSGIAGSGGAMRNNWVRSPMKKRKAIHSKARTIVSSHSAVKDSIKEDFHTMAELIRTAKKEIVSRLSQQQKANTDRAQTQSMRVEQLELELESAKNEASTLKKLSEGAPLVPTSAAEVLPLQRSLLELEERYEELKNSKVKADLELENQKAIAGSLANKLSATETSLGLLSKELASEKERAALVLENEERDEILEQLAEDDVQLNSYAKMCLQGIRETLVIKKLKEDGVSRHQERRLLRAMQLRRFALDDVATENPSTETKETEKSDHNLVLAAETKRLQSDLAREQKVIVDLRSQSHKHGLRLEELLKANEALENTVKGLQKKLTHRTSEKEQVQTRLEDAQEALSRLSTQVKEKDHILEESHKLQRQSLQQSERANVDVKHMHSKHETTVAAMKEELRQEREKLAVEARRLSKLQRQLKSSEKRERRLSDLIVSTDDPNLTHLMDIATQRHHHEEGEDSDFEVENGGSNPGLVIPGGRETPPLYQKGCDGEKIEQSHHHNHDKRDKHSKHHKGIHGRGDDAESPEKKAASRFSLLAIRDASFSATLAKTSSKLRAAALGSLGKEGGSTVEDVTAAMNAELTRSTAKINSLIAALAEKEKELVHKRKTLAMEAGKAKDLEEKFLAAELETVKASKEIEDLHLRLHEKDAIIDTKLREKADLIDKVDYLHASLKKSQADLLKAREDTAAVRATVPTICGNEHKKAEVDSYHHNHSQHHHHAKLTAELMVKEGHENAMVKVLSSKHMADKEVLRREIASMSAKHHHLKEKIHELSLSQRSHRSPTHAEVSQSTEHSIKEQEKAIEAAIKGAEATLRNEMEGQMDTLNAKIRALESGVMERDVELKKMTYNMNNHSSQLTEAQGEIRTLNGQIDAYRAKIEEMQHRDSNSFSGSPNASPSVVITTRGGHSPPAFTAGIHRAHTIEEGEEDGEDADTVSSGQGHSIQEESSTDLQSSTATSNANAAADFAKKSKESRMCAMLDPSTLRGGKAKRKPGLHLASSRESITTSRDRAATEVQRIIRGWLARVLVGHLMTEKAAQHQGILVAYRGSGTRQGEAGWYVSNGQLFYFALDKGEFVLVCGPLTEQEYDDALNECINNNIAPRPTLAGEIEIDRLGLVALRIEVKRYKHRIEASERDLGPGGALQHAINELKQQIVNKEQEIMELQRVVEEKNMDIQAQKLLATKQEKIATETRQKLSDVKMELTTLQDNIHLKRTEGIISTSIVDPSAGTITPENADRGNRRFIANPGGISASEIAGKFARLPITVVTTKRIVKLQACVRGYIRRSKDKNKQEFLRASADGVLVAMKGTTQGKSGWYRAPDDRVYYFTLSREDWIMTAGPLTVSTYQDLLYGPLPLPGIVGRKGDFDEGTPTDTPKVTRSKRLIDSNSSSKAKRQSLTKKRKQAIEAYRAGNLLTKANCEMQVVHPDLVGELFIDRSTKHLFFAVNLEQMVKSSYLSR